MRQVFAADARAARRIKHTALLLAAVLVAAAMAMLLLNGGAELLKGAVKEGPGSNKGGAGQFSDITGAIADVQRPLTIGFGSLVSVGLVAGGACMAVGSRFGMKLITTSGLAGAVVLVGNGVAA